MSNRFWRGLSVGLPLSLVLWAGIIFAGSTLVGCAKEPFEENLWRLVQR